MFDKWHLAIHIFHTRKMIIQCPIYDSRTEKWSRKLHCSFRSPSWGTEHFSNSLSEFNQYLDDKICHIEQGLSTWDTGNNVCTRVTNCFSAHERVILVFISELRSNEGNKHRNNSQVSAEIVRHESTYIILFLTRHNDSINGERNDDLYTSSPCLTRSVFVLLMTSQSISDDVTMTRQLCEHVIIDI